MHANPTVRKAKIEDLDRIESIYGHIHDEEESERVKTGWIRGVYPVRKTAEDALKRGDLFVMEDRGKTVATAIINHIQVPAYYKSKWKHGAADDEIMVLHTLIVDPGQNSRGYGKAFVVFYEQYAKEHGCNELRMDTNALNVRARAMYKKLGYEETDVIPCDFNGIPDVMLVCLEKHLD